MLNRNPIANFTELFKRFFKTTNYTSICSNVLILHWMRNNLMLLWRSSINCLF